MKLSLCCSHKPALWILDVLSETSSTTGAFRALPELEDLELILVYASVARVVDFISTRWNCAGTRTLKTLKLTRGPVNPSGYFPQFDTGDDPSTLPSEWDAVKQFIREGFLLKIS